VPLYVEREELPVLRLRFVEDYTDDELQEFLCELDAVLALAGRKVCIIDLNQATPATAKQRKLITDWIRDNDSVLSRDFSAAAIVTDSALIRGTVTAVFWIRPLPLPTHVAATMEEARDWLRPYLGK
jgi:hypothetical protein